MSRVSKAEYRWEAAAWRKVVISLLSMKRVGNGNLGIAKGKGFSRFVWQGLCSCVEGVAFEGLGYGAAESALALAGRRQERMEKRMDRFRPHRRAMPAEDNGAYWFDRSTREGQRSRVEIALRCARICDRLGGDA